MGEIEVEIEIEVKKGFHGDVMEFYGVILKKPVRNPINQRHPYSSDEIEIEVLKKGFTEIRGDVRNGTEFYKYYSCIIHTLSMEYPWSIHGASMELTCPEIAIDPS